ncbi:30S ribosomal protein S16 [Candidatus Shapirobacteria bacterium]|nr:30S ribosomal protein S16 [Candidatus Shapirobacteria bacterium]
MLKIKLLPRGKKHQRTFRIVVAEARTKANGKFTADLGFYTPQTKELVVDRELVAKWLKNGAQLAFGVDKLLNPEKFPKKVKVKPAKAVETTETEAPVEAKE